MRPPPANGFLNAINGIAIGDDLLLNVDAGTGDAQAQWVNLVLEPGAVDTSGVPNPRIVTSPGGRIVYPGTVTAGDLGRGRCVRVKPVADKPARIWAQVFSGRRGGAALSNRVAFRFTAPGARSRCLTLVKRPAGFYTGKVFRIVFEVRTGATPKPGERTRPPWRTQPILKLQA